MNIEDYRDMIPDFEKFVARMNEPQPYWLRVNTLKITEDELIHRLEDKGFVLERFAGMNAYRIKNMPVKHPGATVEHSLGYYYVQDFSSMVPALLLSPSPGELVLDMAAAPGSKTTLLAELMKNTGTIVANDVSDNRIKALAANIERLGVSNAVITKGDATSRRFGAKFDKILLDAPCTGEGTYRKNQKERMPNLSDHIRMSKIQKNMLKNAERHLKEGGVMIYSTCTFNPLENEEVVQYGVEELGLKIENVELAIPHDKGVSSWKDWSFEKVSDKMIRIYPHRIDTGGMVIAVLKK